MVKVNRKFVALLLMSIMLVSMIAFSASAFEGKAATSGGNLNIWLDKTLKGTKIATVPNGTKLGNVIDLGKGVGEVVYGGVTGYVRLSYVAKVTAPATPTKPTETWAGSGKAATTGGNLNIWADKSLKGTKLATIPNGTPLNVIQAYKEGYAEVEYKGIEGYVRTKYLAQVKPVAVTPAALVWEGAAKASTSGGDMNVWEKENFTGKKMLTIKNGKPVGYVKAYKDGVARVYDKQGGTLLGYARVKYLGKVAPAAVVTPPEELWKGSAVANTTGGDMHVWEKENFTGKKILTIKNGKSVGNVVALKNGVAEVYDEDWSLIGYARAKYVKPAVATASPEIKVTKEIHAAVKIKGTAKDSVIYAWKDMTKKDGSKKGSYGALPVGTEIRGVESYDNGWTLVGLKQDDGTYLDAYVMTKYIEVVKPVVK